RRGYRRCRRSKNWWRSMRDRGASSTEPLCASLSEVVVREAWSASEVEVIFQIRDEVFVDEQQLTDDARNDPDDRSSIHFLALIDDEIVGTGRLTMHGREAQVAWVATRVPWRGQGVGKAIMRAIIARGRREGADHVMLNAQTHAIRFYEDLGFRAIGSEFFMSGIGHQVMVQHFDR
ncbi:MAG TPA: GNAT family N-acetyltransferase, partial [Thermomicrobiales bacterium]|nr:GNAT family N-acetyltransferase [Thermomicrobiales bacterium]